MTLDQLLHLPEIKDLSDADAAAALTAQRDDRRSSKEATITSHDLDRRLGFETWKAIYNALYAAGEHAVLDRLRTGVDFGDPDTIKQINSLITAGVLTDQLAPVLHGFGFDQRSLCEQHGIEPPTADQIAAKRAYWEVLNQHATWADAAAAAHNSGASAAEIRAAGGLVD